jgi:hypothetical protein
MMERIHNATNCLGGALLASAVPHFVCGAIERCLQSPFTRPPGRGLTGSTIKAL